MPETKNYLLTGDKDNDRLLKYFLYPTLIINSFIMTVVPEYRTAGIIYIILGGLTWLFYITPRFHPYLLGIPLGNFWWSISIGIATTILFAIVNGKFPWFTLGLPELPFALSNNVKAFIIIAAAPIVEESLFRSALPASLMGLYGLKFWQANLVQTIIFPIYHFLAYGIVLGAYNRWIDLFGAVNAISGLFIAAGLFAFVAGISIWYGIKMRGEQLPLEKKKKNLLISIISHAGINAVLFTAAVVTFSVV